MITFKSLAELAKLDPNNTAYPVMKELIELLIVAYDSPERPYNADDDGYLVLIQEGDLDGIIDLPELECNFFDVPWEGASMYQGFFYAIYLANNEFGIGFLIPDEPWVEGEVRALLNELVAY